MRSRDPEKERLIRENALKLFFKEGLEGFSMQKLARASSVSPATLYIYFKDKNDLILSIYREEMQKMSDYALRGFDPEMPFAEGLRVQWKNRALYYMEHPLPSHFLEQIRYTPFHEQAAKLADPVFLHAMRTFMENAVKRRELARLPLEVFWALAYAPLYQLLKYHIHGHSFPGMPRFNLNDAVARRTLKLVLKALKP
jgi:TetR/AcrR family transcriptional repressor of multidrug resistance operon